MSPEGERPAEAAESALTVVTALGESTAGVERRAERDRVEYARGNRPFAVVERDRIRFRLRPDVARAALTTPGTSRDPTGPEWIALESARRDRFSRDRARAWFEFAYLQAGVVFTQRR